MKKFPVLLSIPHGGTKVPEEVKDIITIKEDGILRDIDPFTREIYNLREEVDCFIETEIPRTFVDLNRAINDLPPQNPDGIIKNKTCVNEEIYIPGKEPGDILIKTLIDKYYLPYHSKLNELTKTPGLKYAFDCHSMLPEDPPISKTPGKKRPLVCLGGANGKSCPNSDLEILKKCFIDILKINEKEVTVNTPFSGGHITRTYGNKPIPWIQIELNRKLYLPEGWYESPINTIDKNIIFSLNKKIHNVIEMFLNIDD